MSAFKRPPARPKNADEFIAAGQVQTIEEEDTPAAEAKEVKTAFPWEGVKGAKRTETFLLRITPATAAKLAYIAENTPESRQSFLQGIIEPAIEKKIRELTKGR